MTNTLTNNKNLLPISSGFKMVLASAPNTAYFCQSITLPAMVNGETTVSRPLVDAHVPGPKTSYDPLQITMFVSENMDNYLEMMDWIVNQNSLQDDIRFMIVNSKNNVNRTVVFKNAFPTQMGSITFSTQDADIAYATVDVTFRYDYFTLE